MFNAMELILTKDDKGRQIIAGRTGRGKSTMARTLAKQLDYLYITDEGDISPQTAQEWIKSGLQFFGGYIKGLVVDMLFPEEFVTDFNSTTIPIIYTKQLNRNAIKNIQKVNEEQDLYSQLLEVIQPYMSDFTGYNEKEKGFDIVQAIKELLEQERKNIDE